MAPHAPELILIHGMTGNGAVLDLLFPVCATADIEPLIAFGLQRRLATFENLDIVGGQKSSRAEIAFVMAQQLAVDFGRRALEQGRLVIDIGLIDADRMQAAEMGLDLHEVRKDEDHGCAAAHHLIDA